MYRIACGVRFPLDFFACIYAAVHAAQKYVYGKRVGIVLFVRFSQRIQLDGIIPFNLTVSQRSAFLRLHSLYAVSRSFQL